MAKKTKTELKEKKFQLAEEMETIDNEIKSIDDLPSYELNTGDSGAGTIEISNIKGKLDCIIIDTVNKIDLIIESSIGYLILKRNEVYGVNYFAPRVRIVPQENDLRDRLTFDKFNLDEKLIITVMGPKKSAVKIIIRFD